MSETPFTIRGGSPFPADGKENEQTPRVAKGSTTKTPSKLRVSLGAPAGFYFKYMNSAKKSSANTSVLDESMADDNLTGTISIPGLNKSVNLAETSIMSIGASSSGSSDQSDGDMLNKSTLSDTTDLTASSFVLQATSRQVMRQLSQSAKKQKAAEYTENNQSAKEEYSSTRGEKKALDALPQIATASPSPLELLVQESNKGPASTKSSASTQSMSLLAEDTLPQPMTVGPAASSARCQSLRGTSPSLRQRVSATPQSLQKFTQDLRNQRMNRQESLRRLSVDSKNSIQSLNAQLESLNQEDNGTLDRKRLPPAFVPIKSVNPLDSVQHQSCTTQDLRGAMEEIFAEEALNTQNSEAVTTKDPTESYSEESVPTSIDISVPYEKTSEAASIVDEGSPLAALASPSRRGSTQKSICSSTRLTPTKLKSTPRRLPNPKLLDSPARNTRSSAKKKVDHQEEELVGTSELRRKSQTHEAVSLSLLFEPNEAKLDEASTHDRLVNQSTTQTESDTASLGDLMDVFESQPLENSVDAIPKKEEYVKDNNFGMNASMSEFNDTAATSEVPIDAEEIVADSQDKNEPVLASDEGDTASLADLSEILGSQKTEVLVDKSDNSESPSESAGEEHSAGPEISGIEFGVSRSIEASIELHSQESKESIPTSPTQSEGDTASLGDLSSVLVGSQRKASRESLSTIETFKDPEAVTTLSQVKAKSAVENSVVSYSVAKSPESKEDQPRTLEARQESMPSPMDIDSPALSSSHSEHVQIDQIKTQASHSEAEESSLTQEFIASNIENVIQESDTASLSDLAEILGSVRPQKEMNNSSEESLVGQNEHLSESNDIDGTVVNASAKESLSPSTSQVDGIRDDTRIGSEAKDSPASRKRSRSPGVTSIFSPSKADYSSVYQRKSPMRLTPNSHKKPTPTKLASSPRRVVNPKSAHSPARNTRSAKKAAIQTLSPEEPGASNLPLSILGDMEGKENKDSQVERNSIDFDLDGDTKRNKRRKSSIHGLPLGPLKDHATIEMSLSPLPQKSQPSSILSSRKKLRSAMKSSQRSVAFGSPEAAEYHIGSPSMSMTPMPPSKAKALFAIPKNDTSLEGSEMSLDDGEQTVEIETDLNVLVDKITVDNMQDSPALSPISSVRDETAPVILPGNYELSTKTESVLSSTVSTMGYSREENSQRGEMTVELEGGIDGLLENVVVAADQQSPTIHVNGNQSSESIRKQDLSPADTSVDMTDAQSIASVNSVKSDKFTSKLRLDAQKLNFSPSGVELNTSQSPIESMDIDEGHTIELENGMTGLLAAAGVRDSLAGLKKTLLPPAGQGTPIVNMSVDKLQGVPSISQAQSSSIAFDEDASVVSKRSRRSSIASHRFSLQPDDGIFITEDGSIKPRDNSYVSERSVSFQLSTTSEIRPSMSLAQEPVTLTFAEILDISAISSVSLHPSKDLTDADVLIRFNGAAVGVSTIAVSQRWNQFMQAVCSEVERRTDVDGTAARALESLFESQPERFVDLQRQLRSKEGDKVNSAIHKLLIDSQQAVGVEWEMWIGSVMESFGNPLNEVGSELAADFASAEKLSGTYEQILREISLVNRKKVQRARRKSLMRRKVRNERCDV